MCGGVWPDADGRAAPVRARLCLIKTGLFVSEYNTRRRVRGRGKERPRGLSESCCQPIRSRGLDKRSSQKETVPVLIVEHTIGLYWLVCQLQWNLGRRGLELVSVVFDSQASRLGVYFVD